MLGTSTPSISRDYAYSAGIAEYASLWDQGIGFWGMGLGRTGGEVNNLFGGNKLTLTNMNPAVDWEKSDQGDILYTKGGDDILVLDKNITLSVTDKYSVSWRFEYISGDINAGIFRSDVGKHGWWVDVANERVWGRHNGFDVTTFVTGPTVDDGQYHDIVVSWDGQVAKIYKDGKLADSDSNSSNEAWTIQRFAEQFGDNIDARFSEIGMWRRALSETETEILHKVRLAPAVMRRVTTRKVVAAPGVARPVEAFRSGALAMQGGIG